MPEFPDRLNVLLGKQLLFKVAITASYNHLDTDHKYIVIQVSDNNKLKQKFKSYKTFDEVIFF